MRSIPLIQADLEHLGIDGWLFVNHHSIDPIAIEILGLDPTKTCTRRWWYFIPRRGEPIRLVHSVEPNALNLLPGELRYYATYRSLHDQLARLLAPGKNIAMQYSPNAELPMISLIDGGTVELVRSCGASVVSSAELLQRHYAQLTDGQIQSHARAMTLVHEAKDAAFALVRDRAKTAQPMTDLGLQLFLLSRFEEMGLTCDNNAPIVGVNENASDPHFAVNPSKPVPICPGDRLLLDLWGRLKADGSVYADICWCAFVGNNPPTAYERLFGIAVQARDAAVQFLQERLAKGVPITGAAVDQSARSVFEREGVAALSVHRTGHSIDTSVHGRGANIDGYETNDTRLIIPRSCFSIEPALYDPPIGVRSEINVVINPENAAVVYGPKQGPLVCLG